MPWVVSGFMGALLAASAWHKLQDPHLFHAHLHAYEVVPSSWSEPLSRILPWVEITLAFWICMPWGGWVGYGLAAALIMVYAGAMAWNLFRGRRDIDCGCGGPAIPVQWKLVIRNVVMACALGIAPMWTSTQTPGVDMAIAMMCGVVMWMVYALVIQVMAMMSGMHSGKKTIMG